MNELKIKEAQKKALRKAKAEVARLNDLLIAARFWHAVAEAGIIEPEQVKPKAYKRVKCMVIGITIAVLLAIVCFGCNVAREGLHLVGAAGQDVGWMANKVAENIQTEK